jgi:hypothetical protein
MENLAEQCRLRKISQPEFAPFAHSSSCYSGIQFARLTRRILIYRSEGNMKRKLFSFFAIVAVLTLLTFSFSQHQTHAVASSPERTLFQDNFQRADSTWVGNGWREYTRRNDQFQAADSPWQIRGGTLYFEAVGSNGYIEDFIETAATFPVENVRVDFDLHATVTTSKGYVGPNAFWSGEAFQRSSATNVASGPGHIGVAAFNSWETGGARGLVVSNHGGAQVYKDMVLAGVNQPGFAAISITVRGGQVIYSGQGSPAISLGLSQPLGPGAARHWTFGARLYDAGVSQVIQIRNLRITALN